MTAAPSAGTRSSGIVLGLDFGKRRIGVALGNLLLHSARPLTTLQAGSERQWKGLADLIRDWRPEALVVGRPLNEDGKPQAILTSVERFMQELRARYGLPVHAMDERFTSLAAQSELKQQRARGERTQARFGEEDAEAARFILEDWLQQQARHTRSAS